MVREIAGVLILGVSATVAMAQSPPAVSADTSMWDPSVSRAADQNLSRKLSQTGGVITPAPSADLAIVKAPPVPDPGPMTVVPPPGTPGSKSPDQPK